MRLMMQVAVIWILIFMFIVIITDALYSIVLARSVSA